MTDTAAAPYLEAQARREEMEERIAALERALAAATGASGWASSVQFRLVDLRGALAAHVVAVEAPDGLLAEIVDGAPRLANAVQRMKDDHAALAEEIDSLVESALTVEPATLRERGLELMRDMVLHRHRGSDLVYEAFARDIGGQS